MRISVHPLRRLVAGTAAGAVSLALMATVGAVSVSAAAPGGTVASGDDWSITSVAGGYEVTLDLDEPLPMIDDAPVLTVDGVALGTATESADGLSLSVVSSDPTLPDATSVDLGWSSGGTTKVEATNSPVTSTEAPVEPTAARDKALGAAVARAADDDGSTPGPYSYRQDDYDYGDQAIAMAGISGIRGELTGRIYRTSAAGARPTVILLHGRHTSCATVPNTTGPTGTWPCIAPRQTEVPSYKGYDGTGQTLATWGYNVVSISANAINANDASLTVDNGALARGQLVIDSLAMIAKWNAGDPAVYHDAALNQDLTIDQALDAPQADVGTPDLNQLNAADLTGVFDLTNVGLMGHSRGGEGVTSAVTLNQALAQPYGIKSVLPLAPVDFSRMTVGNIPTLLMLPYCDGDVSNQQGQHFIDDSRYAYNDSVLRSTVWVMGANHNFFNSVWTPGKYAYSTADDWGATSTDSVCGPRATTNIRLTADQEYAVGTAYMTAWFRMTVPPVDTGFLPMFDGTTKPTLTSVPSADIRVLASAPSADRVDIEPFTAFDGRVRNYGTGTANVCASASGRTLPQQLPFCATTTTTRSTSAMPHWTPASYAPNVPASPMTKFLWTSNTGQIRITVPAAARNAAAYDTLLFKTAPDESVVTGTDMTLTVVDGAGATWSSLVSALNPLAVNRMPASTTSTLLNKIVLQQVSVPVSSMTGINTSDIREIRFTAGTGADATATGGVYLSDLSLARSSIGTPTLLSSAPTINVDPTRVEEGNSSADSKFVAVTLSKPSTTTATGWLTLIGSTATTAKAGLAATQVTFAPGETCKAVEVPTFGDALQGTAATTSYKTEISNNTGVVYGNQAFGTLTVREDDGVVTTTTPPAPAPSAPAVGVQGDVCAEYAAKSQTFPMTASVTEPAPGTSTAITGTGFRSGESVSFVDESTSPATVIGTAIADPSGVAAVSLVLPPDAALGARRISATGAGSIRKEAVGISVLAPTTTTLTLSPAAPAIQQPVTLTATVSGASTAGTVTFSDGTTTLGTAPVKDAVATLELPGGFLAGDHALSVSFPKTDTASASTSNTLAFTLVKGVSTSVIGLSAASTTYGTGASGTVTVGGAAGGSVTLTGAGATATVPLDSAGKGTFTLPDTLAPGTYPLSVAYAGSEKTTPSSASATYTVTKATPQIVVIAQKSKLNRKKAKATLLVSVVGAGGAAPSGPVRVNWDGTSHTVAATPGGSLVKLKKKARGKRRLDVTKFVVATYAGDANYDSSQTRAIVFFR